MTDIYRHRGRPRILQSILHYAPEPDCGCVMSYDPGVVGVDIVL